jgi:hypothetical protein
MAKKGRYISDGYSGQTPIRFCPVCFHKLDGVTNLQGKEKPRTGDFTICIECANVLKFTDNLDMELSSLEAIPVESRFDFAKVVMTLKTLGAYASRFTRRM